MKKYVFFNEDPNHFVFERMRAGKYDITADDINSFIDGYKETDITDFLICLNASMCWYPSRRTDNAIDKYRLWLSSGKITDERENTVTWGAKMNSDLYAAGLDYRAMWIERLREIGIRPWISIRMNDIHGSAKKGDFLNSTLVEEHPEYRRTPYREPLSNYDCALDYMREDVRNYYLTVIEESLSRYDADGIELDFMREAYCLCVGREYEGIAVMTDFMRSAHSLIMAAGEKRGKRIKTAVRLPADPELAMRLGFDAFTWADEGLVDVITVSPRWSSVDNNMPIDIWKRIFEKKGVLILAGLEILLEPYPRRPRKYLSNTLESARGSCCAYLSMGADGMYLFNYMDTLVHESEKGDCLANRGMDEFLRSAGNPALLEKSDRRHIVTYCDVSAPGAARIRQLPAKVSESGYSLLRIPTGNIPKDARVTLVLGFTGESKSAIPAAYANAMSCRYIGKVPYALPMYDDIEYHALEIANDGNLPPVTVAEIYSRGGSGTVSWAEIQIAQNK